MVLPLCRNFPPVDTSHQQSHLLQLRVFQSKVRYFLLHSGSLKHCGKFRKSLKLARCTRPLLPQAYARTAEKPLRTAYQSGKSSDQLCCLEEVATNCAAWEKDKLNCLENSKQLRYGNKEQSSWDPWPRHFLTFELHASSGISASINCHSHLDEIFGDAAVFESFFFR